MTSIADKFDAWCSSKDLVFYELPYKFGGLIVFREMRSELNEKDVEIARLNDEISEMRAIYEGRKTS